jgi:hypothetical protein
MCAQVWSENSLQKLHPCAKKGLISCFLSILYITRNRCLERTVQQDTGAVLIEQQHQKKVSIFTHIEHIDTSLWRRVWSAEEASN